MISNHTLNHPVIKSKLISHEENKHSLVVDPLLPGFGNTLGNSLRRIFLSSIPGFAVTKVRINDLTHEYQTLEGVVEDALDIILNLKLLRTKIITDDDTVVLTLTKNSQGEVTAADFQKNAKVQVVNPDLYICYLDKNTPLTIEVEISRGVGYLSADEIKQSASTNPQDILVDALFSPITNVALEVEQVRVGDKTNYDKIELKFDTDKSVEAEEVVDYALNVAIDMFSKIKSSLEAGQSGVSMTDNRAPVEAETINIINSTNSEIDLPTRIKNILQKNEVRTNEELKARIDEISEFAGITEKSMQTIRDYIKTVS